MTSKTDSSALVIFSGGQDSATCLGWALNRFDRVFTVGFDYGQRHHVEMECRRNVLNAVRSDASLPALWAARLGEDTLLSLGLFNQIGETAMTSDMEIAFNEQGIPNTFVPGRNLVFLTAAAALAWRKGIRHLVEVRRRQHQAPPKVICSSDWLSALASSVHWWASSSLRLYRAERYRQRGTRPARASSRSWLVRSASLTM